MPDNNYNNSPTRPTDTSAEAPKSLVRREPGLTTLMFGLAVMVVTLLLPQAHRPFAFYPALAIVAIGVLLVLRHGPDRLRNTQG